MIIVCAANKVNMALNFIPVIVDGFSLEPVNNWKVILFGFLMAPHASRVKVVHPSKTRAALATEEAVARYHDSVSHSVQEAMHPLKEEVKIIRAYQDDVDIDKQVGDIILDLGSTRN
jgi:hypothetical protein